MFQRTPSAIGWRGNHPTDAEFVASLEPGWQRERTDNFSAVMIGKPVEVDLVADAWGEYTARVANFRGEPGMSPDELALAAEAFDYSVMEEHRVRVDAMVDDPTVAEALKPYYRYLCKRPLFHDEYLAAFNLPTVTLVDCPAGIDAVTETGLVANGREYAVDCIVYATGFEAEVTPFPRRAAHEIVGRDGVSIEAEWKDGPGTLHGIMSRGFPNLFLIPAPGQQAVITHNITHLYTEGALHIAETIAALEARGAQRVDVSEQAEAAWTQRIVDDWKDNRAFMAACTPSRLNFEGHPEAANPKAGNLRRRLRRHLRLPRPARRVARRRDLPRLGDRRRPRGALTVVATAHDPAGVATGMASPPPGRTKRTTMGRPARSVAGSVSTIGTWSHGPSASSTKPNTAVCPSGPASDGSRGS